MVDMLRVELAGLDLHAVGTEVGGSVITMVRNFVRISEDWLLTPCRDRP